MVNYDDDGYHVDDLLKGEAESENDRVRFVHCRSLQLNMNMMIIMLIMLLMLNNMDMLIMMIMMLMIKAIMVLIMMMHTSHGSISTQNFLNSKSFCRK